MESKTEKRYALLGENISYSLSPKVHGYILQKLGLAAEYDIIDCAKEKLEATVDKLRLEYNGFNITKPYKSDIISYLDCNKSEFDAVNTVQNSEGKLIGYNTDYYGFLKDFEMLNVKNINKKKVLVLGAGGVSRVVIAAFKNIGADVAIFNRTYLKAEQLSRIYDVKAIADCNGLRPQIIVNCTSAGLSGEQAMNDKIDLSALEAAYDTIYLANTPFCVLAKSKGAKVRNGLGMLLWQAIEAQNIWQRLELTHSQALDVFEFVEKNIIREM